MAVSITTRPSTWSAVKNPVTYKFTSTGHGALANYRIEVEVFKSSDNTSLTGGVRFSFSPDASGVTYADISKIVKAYLSPEWSNPTGINHVETETSLGIYIKYQELYDGSATSVVNDVANPIICVFAGNQIGSANGSSLEDYVLADVNSKFLTALANPKIWRGYPASFSFLMPTGYDDIRRDIKQFNSANVELTQDYVGITLNTNKVNRLSVFNDLLALEDDATRVHLTLTGAGLNSGSGSGALTDRTEEILLGTTIPPGRYKFYISAAISSGTIANKRIEINVNDNVFTTGVEDTGVVVTKDLILPDQITDYIDVTHNIDRFHVKFYTAGIAYSWSYMVGIYLALSETKEMEVETPCDNPVMLFWKNSLGGDAFWLFDADQEVSYQLSGNKAKRMVLTANNLTADQWEALNELNHLGEVYKENIVEFTSSVNKSHKRDGAQVYMVDADGNKTGVIVIPTNNVMFTRMRRHQFRIEIELPERYE